MTLRVATRRSALALWQSERIATLLRQRGKACQLVPMHTEGDRILDRSLSAVGGKGLFVKELEEALAQNRADLAVHSAKEPATFWQRAASRPCRPASDVPTASPGLSCSRRSLPSTFSPARCAAAG